MPIESAISPVCKAGAADLDQRLADMDAEGIDVQVLFGGLIIGLTSYDDRRLRARRRPRVQRLAADEGVRPQPRTVEGRRRRAAAGRGTVGRRSRARGAARRGRGHDPAGRRRRATSTTQSLLPFFEACASLDLAVAVHSAPGMNLPLAGRGAVRQLRAGALPVVSRRPDGGVHRARDGRRARPVPDVAGRVPRVGNGMGAVLRPPHARALREARRPRARHEDRSTRRCSSGASATSASKPKSRCS